MHVGAPFLPPLSLADRRKPCLVLDLDETLVHSSFKPVPNPDFVIPVEIDGVVTDVYVLKRPWVDYFLEQCAARYEIVVFTASLSKYADPLLDFLDPRKTIKHRLFRESCYLHQVRTDLSHPLIFPPRAIARTRPFPKDGHFLGLIT